MANSATSNASLSVRLATLGEGISALLRLVGPLARAARGPAGAAGAVAAVLGEPVLLRRAGAAMRALKPTLRLSQPLMGAYPSTGTLFVARDRDVREVLDRDADFEVVYGPRMRTLTGGGDFLLGIPAGPDHSRDQALLTDAFRPADLPALAAVARDHAQATVAAAAGQVDLPLALTNPALAASLAPYFGLGQADPVTLTEELNAQSWFLFSDFAGDPQVTARAETAGAALRAALDAAIAARHGAPAVDDPIGRLLAQQAAGAAATSDVEIRNLLMGVVIGAQPNLAKAAALAVDTLLDRPAALAQAQAAAARGDDAALLGVLMEALRFTPFAPLIYRRVVRDTKIGGRARATKGDMVYALAASAMFDRAAVAAPGAFRADRPDEGGLHFGAGPHACFGRAISRALLPAVLGPLLARPGLARAAGAAGQLDTGDTPFPQHLHLRFDTP